MSGETTELHVYGGLMVIMVAYWTYYIRCVRRTPQTEK